uniref:mitogen-activated protein kinase kinase n=1 Tax=Leersia perrieri TaxID=77586 RepID=A0A0D9WLU0_9ORYZ
MAKPPKLALPSHETTISKFLTQSGTFKDGDLLVNKDGLRIVSQSEEGEAPPVEPLDHNQLSVDDLDAIKVIGKGSSGIVQLVQHKWTGQFFAMKVIQLNIQEDIRRQIAEELKISLSSQCQYVVACCQCFYVNGVISIVLEYMDGGSLSDFLKTVKTIPEPYLAAISVVDHPPPSAPSDQFSEEFCSFVSACIQKKASDRSSAQTLLNHPFLSLYDDLNIDLASYFMTSGSPLATFNTSNHE